MIRENLHLEKKRISSVDMLRGIAALAVGIYHFTNGNRNYFSDSYWLKHFGHHGWAGVEVFFVISGFVIPYSLYQGRYKLSDFGSFFLKRVARIEPPYFISIALVFVMAYLGTLSPYYKGSKLTIDFFNLSLHFVYLNDFLKQPWLNPVFWTLAIEFQFYLLIGLIFPAINHRKIFIFLITILLLAASCFLTENTATIFHFLLYFILGILIFYKKTNIHYKKWILSVEILVLACIYMKFSIVPFTAALFAWIVISFFEKWENKWLLWMGTISYSFYLIHVPIGGRLINFSVNFAKTDASRTFILLLILIITLFFSYLFNKFIEKPVIRFSHSIFKKNKKQ